MKGGWRYVLQGNGALYVMMDGVTKRLMLFVGNLASAQEVYTTKLIGIQLSPGVSYIQILYTQLLFQNEYFLLVYVYSPSQSLQIFTLCIL